MVIKETRAKTLKSIRGLSVTITGQCWISQKDLAYRIRRQGGRVTTNNTVTYSTEILVRGASGQWKYKTHGRKEAKAAQLIRQGQSIKIVPADELRKLIETGKPAQLADTVAGQPLEWLKPPSKQVFEEITKISGGLDREYTVNGRREQGYLRALLFQGKSISTCGICGREFPVELLIAAHIKPRSKCTQIERRDAPNIVFPLCLFGCDSLYEQGIVSIDQEGYVVAITASTLTKSVSHYLRSIRGRKCEFWTENSAPYFQWHYERKLRI